MCGRIKKRYGNAARKCDRSQRSDQKIQSIYGQGQSVEGAGAVSPDGRCDALSGRLFYLSAQ